MTAPATVEVTITPEAAERLAELGMQAEYEQMLQHIRETIPGLRQIEVEERPMYDTHEDTGVRINAIVNPFREEDELRRRLKNWFYDTFPPAVWENFDVNVYPETGHAG